MASPPKAANEHRGEVSIELEGVAYTLRPSYEAIVEVEKQCGATIGAMAMAAGNLALPLASLAVIVTEFVKAQGRATDDKTMVAVNLKRIGELILGAGVVGVSVKVAGVLVGASTGGYTPAGEAKPTTGIKTTAPSVGN